MNTLEMPKWEYKRKKVVKYCKRKKQEIITIYDRT